jgi:hypothetical protein
MHVRKIGTSIKVKGFLRLAGINVLWFADMRGFGGLHG